MALQLLVNGVDFTSSWRWEQSRWSTRAWQGESVQSEFLIDDPTGAFVHSNFAARKIVEVWEDASGSPKCMYRGRIANKTLGPGNFFAPGHAMRWTLLTEDFNIDLRGIRVINAERPEETNYERAEVIRLAYLNGAASTHASARDSTDLDGLYIGPTPADAFTLDAETYTDIDPVGVLTQMTEMDGHLFFVYLQNDGVGALVYMGITDEEILSNISIVDDGEDEGADGVDIFAAYHLDQAGDHGGQNVLSGAAIRYGQEGSYFEESDVGGREAIYDKWEITVSNDLVTSEASADQYVNTVISANEEVNTYFATIDVRAQDVHRIKAGMMVPLIRKRANKLGNATARAVNVTYEPVMLETSTKPIYHVTLELGRPRFLRTIPPNRRRIPRPPVQPVAGSCTRLYFSSATAGISPATSAVWDTDSYAPNDALTSAPDSSFTASHASTSSAGGSSTDVRLFEGSFAMSSGLAAIILAGGATVHAQARARSRYGVGISESAQDNISQMVVRVFTSAGVLRGTAYAGHSLSSSVSSAKWPAQATKVNRAFPPAAASNTLSSVGGTVAGDYLVVELGYRSFTVGTTGASLNLQNDQASDLPEDEVSTSTTLNAWLEICSPDSEGDNTEPVGGSGTPGSGTTYAPLNHVHAHGSQAEDGVHDHDLADIEDSETLAQVTRTDSDTPGVTDDEDDGYQEGDIWIDRTADEAYILTDATAGAAVWEQFVPSSGGSGAPTTADYLVGTAQGGLSAEIVVGTTPGGELGGTWASPTVDTVHSGSSHASITTSFVTIAKWSTD